MRVRPSYLIASAHAVHQTWRARRRGETPAEGRPGDGRLIVWRAPGGELRVDEVTDGLFPYLEAAGRTGEGGLLAFVAREMERSSHETVQRCIREGVERGWLVPRERR